MDYTKDKNRGGMLISVDDIIDSFGFNKFSCKLMLVIGILWMSESVETNLMSLIGPELRCAWNLSSLQVSLTSSSVFLGSGIGSIYWGYFGDKYGRKKPMVMGALLITYFGLLSAVSPNFIWFLVLRFFVGIGLGPASSGACYIAELITRNHRGKAVICVDFFYAFGSMYIAFIAFLLMRATSWEVFLVVATTPSLLFLLCSWWLPESVRFLQNTGRYDDLVKILNRISVASGNPIPTKTTIECKSLAARGNISILFSSDYRRQFAVVMVLFISSFWGYFSLALLNTEILQSGGICKLNATVKTATCRHLSNNDYIQNMIVVSAEIPGLLLPVLFIDVVGRKCYTCTNGIISGIGFLCLNFCLPRPYLTVMMYIMRFIMIGYAQIPFLYASELFPTVVRTSAVGIALGVAKISLIAVPYFVQYLAHVSFMATSIIFAVLCFVASAFVLVVLPETKDKPLHNT